MHSLIRIGINFNDHEQDFAMNPKIAPFILFSMVALFGCNSNIEDTAHQNTLLDSKDNWSTSLCFGADATYRLTGFPHLNR